MRLFKHGLPTQWATAILLATSLGFFNSSATAATPTAPKVWSASFDNDFLVPASRDQDYTYGISYAVAQQTEKTEAPAWLAAIGASHRSSRTSEWGLYGFTPANTAPTAIQYDDRPYASLIYTSRSASYAGNDPRERFFSSVTVGVLGLSVVGNAQTEFHKWIGSELPQGWDSQVSEGGELTLRYRLAKQRLHVVRKGLEVSSTRSVSLGYITEAAYGISTRAGHLNSDWQATDGTQQLYRERGAIQITNSERENYIAAGATVRLRAYNAFLQGQFRDSDHTLSHGELNHVLFEGWVSYVRQFGGYQFDYTLKGHSAELDRGKGNRVVLWGGLTLSHRI